MMADGDVQTASSVTDLTAGPAVPVKDSAYRLAYKPDGTSWIARENFADIIERELLGPANGPTEILSTSPDAASLIGRIAPQRLAGADGDPVDADSGEAGSDVGDSADARAGRGVPLAAVEENDPGVDESAAEDAPQLRGLLTCYLG